MRRKYGKNDKFLRKLMKLNLVESNILNINTYSIFELKKSFI